MKHFSQTLKVGLALFVAVFSSGLLPAAVSNAKSGGSPPPQEEKVTICHRTNSVTNPYTMITVNESAVDGVARNSGSTPDHYGEHKGPLASSEAVAQALKSDHKDWGDIIPPVGTHSGLNWSTIGQAMLANSCNYVSTVTPEAPTKLDYCYDDQDGIYVPSTKGVIYKVNGVVTSGWVSYNGTKLIVTAEPETGWVFSDGATTEWMFGEKEFTNEACLVITKTGKSLEDTDGNGYASVGDIVKWEITVTNNGSVDMNEAFYVEVDDPDATVENDGVIDSLAAGSSATLAVSKPLTLAELQVCTATNVASFTAWRSMVEGRSLSLNALNDSEDVSFTGTTGEVEFEFDCATPGSGGNVDSSTSTTTTSAGTTVTSLPATGPADGILLAPAAGAIAYGLTYFIQRRRELATN